MLFSNKAFYESEEGYGYELGLLDRVQEIVSEIGVKKVRSNISRFSPEEVMEDYDTLDTLNVNNESSFNKARTILKKYGYNADDIAGDINKFKEDAPATHRLIAFNGAVPRLSVAGSLREHRECDELS